MYDLLYTNNRNPRKSTTTRMKIPFRRLPSCFAPPDLDEPEEGDEMGSKVVQSLIVGLGNPGKKYLATRHSIGMVACNKLAEHYNVQWEYHRKYKAYTSTIITPRKHVYLLKSNHLMNVNGKSVKKAAHHLNIGIGDIYLLHDDLERAVGKVSWKAGGSAGGHNGVKSVVACLGDDKVRRLRIGIDRPPKDAGHEDVSDYVLSEFDSSEEGAVEDVLEEVVKILKDEIIET